VALLHPGFGHGSGRRVGCGGQADVRRENLAAERPAATHLCNMCYLPPHSPGLRLTPNSPARRSFPRRRRRGGASAMNAPHSLISRLGNVMQLAFVPRDFDAAVRFWTETMGVGPFFLNDHVALR